MNPTELCVGNILVDATRNHQWPCIIREIHQDCVIVDGLYVQDKGYAVRYEDLEGKRLTYVMLHYLGFENTEQQVWRRRGTNWWLWYSSGRDAPKGFYWGEDVIPILWVHRLQNIFQFSTGESLTFNTDT